MELQVNFYLVATNGGVSEGHISNYIYRINYIPFQLLFGNNIKKLKNFILNYV